MNRPDRVIDDAWDPFADPEGNSALRFDDTALRPANQDALAKLRPDEWRALEAARSGERLREIEIDRLVWLGVARRRKDGTLELV